MCACVCVCVVVVVYVCCVMIWRGVVKESEEGIQNAERICAEALASALALALASAAK